MNPRDQIYFCVCSQSCIVEIDKFCSENDTFTLHYFRKLKDGHVPGFRECKISGKNVQPLFLEFIDRKGCNLEGMIVSNPYKVKEEYKCVDGDWDFYSLETGEKTMFGVSVNFQLGKEEKGR